MKIEISADDLYDLKSKISEQDKEIRRLKDELYELNPEKIKRDMRESAWMLFEEHMRAVFDKLGFKSQYRSVQTDCGFWQEVKGDYLNGENVTISLGARIESEFREAYLRLGIKTE